MQLLVRGSRNYLLKFDELNSMQQLFKRIWKEEGCLEVSIYQSGKPILQLEQLEKVDGVLLPIDINVNLPGGKVTVQIFPSSPWP